MIFFRFFLTLLLVVIHTSSVAQSEGVVTLHWDSPKFMTVLDDEQEVLSFSGAYYDFDKHDYPVYLKKIRLPENTDEVNVTIDVVEKSRLSLAEARIAERLHPVNTLSWVISYERKIPYLILSYIPFQSGFKINRFNYQINLSYKNVDVLYRKASVNSVLSQGDWYKLQVAEEGLYRIDYDFLKGMGLNPSEIDPRKIQVYGNGGAMLPEYNGEFRNADLVENSIHVKDQDDGRFDVDDWVLFYGQSPHQWTLDDEKNFKHILNIYDDHNYYFLHIGNQIGKRVAVFESDLNSTIEMDYYTDRKFHEIESTNLKNTGRQWFGEYFSFGERYPIGFDFKNRIKSEPLRIAARAVGRSSSSSSVNFEHGGSKVLELVIGTQVSASTYVDDGEAFDEFYSNLDRIELNATYDKMGNSTAFAYLDYVEVQSKCDLNYTGGQLFFREPSSVGPGNLTKFNLTSTEDNFVVWDVTNPFLISEQMVDESLSFTAATEDLKTFVIHDLKKTSYKTPIFDQKVPNQNLHGQEPADLLIITAPEFLESANRLAQIHVVEDGIKVQVATTDAIYNEFSSGKQDLVAIRSYIRMMYDKAEGDEVPDNVLLFGDASFDYKGIGALKNQYTNQNFVPTFQSEYSFKLGPSYCTDDFLAYLDASEGAQATMRSDGMDVGLGRLVVQTKAEAQAVVDKIEAYYSQESFGEWRGNICFIADDVDEPWEKRLQENIDKIAESIDTSFHNYNLSKIYLDAYPQESSSGGERYPDAQQAIVDNVNKGSLIVHYYGHGGEVGWAEERVLEMDDINSWENLHNLPVFVTATCEFARYDDAKRVSAGERVLLNPKGGGIALFTTTRTITESDAKNLSEAFYNHALPEKAGSLLTFGEVMRALKNDLNSSGISTTNKMKFTLLGDPALKLPIPQNKLVINQVLHANTNEPVDTLKALTKVVIKGEVQSADGLVLDSFNGSLKPRMFDKTQQMQTLSNDQQDLESFYFNLQQSVLYAGNVSVTNGSFEFEFVVPKDIAFTDGKGKISLYAYNDSIDAIGSFSDLYVTGFDEASEQDVDGPSVHLYMNNSDFRYGGITDASPSLYALIADASGINTTGNGIGHDIVATLDDAKESSVVLNHYYESDLDSYQSGFVKYPFAELDEGLHRLKLKVWDVHNNSTEAFTEFVVVENPQLILDNLMNYPNPFSDYTRIHFEHNRPNETLDVQMEIHDLNGALIKQDQIRISNSSYANSDFTWNGTSLTGAPVSSGLYLCRIVVSSLNSDEEEVISNQMILIK